MVKEEKLKQVEEMKNMLEEYSVIGILDMTKMPSKQLQEIKKQLRETAIVKMTKKSILLHAIRNVNKEKFTELEKFIPLQPAIVLTNLEPFKFYSVVNKLKSPTFAKEGDLSEEDITISAGPTSLLPGPAISELNKVGLVAGVEEGKIAIKKDKVVAKKGDNISKELSSVLRKLNIQPVRIGLNIVAIFSDGKIYAKNILNLVGDVYINRMKDAFNQALNLSIYISYPTKENIKLLLSNAYRNAKMLEKFGGAS